ncbi:hypothetical protein C8T65DRAFT_830745 [Cerioporus squamosus]|nr:hypothetical protein C8T65DRAFT_830745 [Cerioporus squamosus]
MSADANAAAIVTLFNALYIEGYWQVAVSVLFICETFGMLEREVRYFWTAKRTGGSLLFFANKCIFVSFYILLLVAFAPFPSEKSCSLFQQALLAIQIVQAIPWAVFSTLRSYVLSRSMLLAGLVLVLSMSPVGANLVRYGYEVSGENFPPFGCLGRDTTTEAMGLSPLISYAEPLTQLRTHIVVIISRAPLIVSDILLIYTTWTKLRGWAILGNIRRSKRLTLSDVLFRGGTIYFIVNLLHLILSIVAVAGLAGTSSSEGTYVTKFTTPPTAILVSRFLLDLQEANQAVVRVDPDDLLHSSRDPYDTPSFISSLGAFINPELAVSADDMHDSESHNLSRSEEEESDPRRPSQAARLTSSSSSA